jgi:Zn-dependent M28 family amino/carboxypeptidase
MSGAPVTSRPRTREAPTEYFGTAIVRANLEALLQLGPRTARNAGALDATLRFLESALASCGYDTQLISFGEDPGDCNLLAHRAGTDPEAPLLEIGAHYDTVDDCPGADDNGSGVIGLLALARYFSQRQLQRSLRFCFFGAEETGLRGSRAHQDYLTREGRAFGGCIVFEMIGYRSHASHSQETPLRVPLLLWPPRTGDFIASVTNWHSRHLATAYRHAASSAQGPKVFPVRQWGGLLQDATRSDHASYWEAGRPAIMLTDTAEFRNPNYHRPSDTLETVDCSFVGEVAWATAMMAEAMSVAVPTS